MDVDPNVKDIEEQQPFLEAPEGGPQTFNSPGQRNGGSSWLDRASKNVTRRQVSSDGNRSEKKVWDSDIDKRKKNKFVKKRRTCCLRCGICCCLSLVVFWLWWLSGQSYGKPGPCSGLEKVSLLISWVNVTDSNWQAESRAAGCPVEYALGAGGDGDPFEALRYNLRAVHNYLPFVDHVYLSTTGQYPSWLDTTQDFVTVLPHKKFTTPSRTLFNGRTVAALWAEIGSKFAGECFIHNDDDFIVNRPLSIDDLFPNGHVRVQPFVNIGFDMPLSSFFVWWYGSNLKSVVADAHTTYAIHSESFKQYCAQSTLCQQNQKATCDEGRKPTEGEYDVWMTTRPDVSYWSNFDIAWRANRFVFGVPWVAPWVNLLGVLLTYPAHINIRSHGGIDSDPAWVNTIRGYLHWKFPDPAPWEQQEQPDWIVDGELKKMT